jgi:hypothetical protein
MPWPVYPALFDHSDNIWRELQTKRALFNTAVIENISVLTLKGLIIGTFIA